MYLEQFYAIGKIDDVDAIENVINYKVSQYTNSQKDSILNAVFNSYEVNVSEFKNYYSFHTNFEIFDKRIAAIVTARPLNKLDSNINITDTTYMINHDWKKFKNIRLYKLLAIQK